MKHNILFCLLAGIVLLAGCYDDKGNYNYKDPFTVTVSGFENGYTVLSMVDEMKISPTIEPANREYEYFWGVYPAQAQGFVPKLDTLGFTRDIDYFVDIAPGSYIFVYGVKDTKTGISSIIERNFNVSTALLKGWYLLKEQSGITDLDLHITDKEKDEITTIFDVIAKNNGGETIQGTPRGFSYMTNVPVEYDGRWKNKPIFFTYASQGLAEIEASTGIIVRDINDFFYDGCVPTVIDPQWVFGGMLSFYFANAGELYGFSTMSVNSGKLGFSITNPNFPNYSVASYKLVSFMDLFVYDNTSCSFINGHYNIGMSQLSDPADPADPHVNNLNSDLIFMTQAGTSMGYLLLKNRTTGDYDFRKVSPISEAGFKNPANQWNLTDSDRITQGKHWCAMGGYDGLFYEHNGKVYYCNIAGSTADALLESEMTTVHSVGEEITYMQYLSSSKVAKMVIATHAGSNYKVYLYDVLAGQLQENPTILEGQGKIYQALYIEGGVATDTY